MHTTYAPYTKLFLHDVHSIVLTANGHIQVLDSSTGSVLYSTTTISTELSEKVQKSGAIVAAAIDESFKYLVTATSDKFIRTWEVTGLRIVSEREAPKKPTDICLTRDTQTILVSDKFGDVHRYPLLASDEGEESSSSWNLQSKTSSKRIADESLLLGHVSLLATLILSKDEKYIFTADRDEHIRVSWYPEAYTIERYCLGHRKFVSALHIPTWDPSLLISGGGDPELKIWKWMEGTLVHDIPIPNAVMPFVKVVRKKPGRDGVGSDGEDEEGASKSSSRAKRRNKKNRKGKEGEPETHSGIDEEYMKENKPDDMQVDDQHARSPGLETPSNGNKPGPSSRREPSLLPLPLLAVQKITALESGSNRYVIFSVNGATALFYCKFPDDSDSSPQIRSIALNQPVLDLTRWPNTNEIWIAVDGNWSESISPTPCNANFIRIAKVVGDELLLSDDSEHQLLANSLNTTSRLEASKDSLKNSDLYSALAVLPKNLDVGHNVMDDDALLSEMNEGQLSGKELGRLKSKKAVQARQAALSSKREQTSTPDENRNLKKQRSESEDKAE